MGRFHQPEKYASAALEKPAPQAEPAVAAAPELPLPDPKPQANRSRVVVVEGANPLAKIGFLATLVYMFGVYSLSEEMAIHFIGFKPYLTTITGIVALLASLFAGGFSNVIRFKPAKFMLGFTAWLFITIPFATWKGGSWETVSAYVSKSLLVMVFLMMTVTTWKQIRQVFYAMTAASLVLTFAVRSSLVELSSSDPRMAFAEGRLANPNDLATHMLVLLPFACGLFFLSGRFSLLRPISIIAAIGALYTVLHSGSRGALITVFILGLLLIWKLPNAVHKAALVVSAFIIAAAAAAVLPSTVLTRYKVLFADDTTVPSDKVESQALESSESRRAILIRSLEVTAANPLFGVGPGDFTTAEADLARGEGQRGAWLQTHNGYTQVSAECGVPAVICFISAIFLSLKIALKNYNRLLRIPEFKGEAVTFLVIFLSLTSFAVNICFASLAYTFYIPSLVGVLGALVLVTDRELKIYESRLQPKPAPAVSSPFGPMFNPRRLNAN